jgi:hypothetical protein
MAHYAFLDENNVVTEVITGIDETELIEGLDTETWYGNFRGQTCKRTSYNGNISKQYAGIGYTYDAVNDVFIAPQPYPSWSLDNDLIGNRLHLDPRVWAGIGTRQSRFG